MSGGIATPSDPIWSLQFSDEEIAAIVDKAQRRRTCVAAHAYTAESIVRAVRFGVRSIEHGNLFEAETATLVADHGAFVVPTLTIYDALERSGTDTGAPDHTLAKLIEVKDRGLEIAHRPFLHSKFSADSEFPSRGLCRYFGRLRKFRAIRICAVRLTFAYLSVSCGQDAPMDGQRQKCLKEES